jgi:hypothetical protein
MTWMVLPQIAGFPIFSAMKDLLVLLIHLLTTVAKVLGPGGAKAVVADRLLMKQQLLIINRSRRRAPYLLTLDRFLDHAIFWNASDLEKKLEEFHHYYNTHRVHTSLESNTPLETCGKSSIRRADLNHLRWKSHCSGLYQLPLVARATIRHTQAADRVCAENSRTSPHTGIAASSVANHALV